MRIAFVGKGGSGKTTISSLFIRLLKEKNTPVLAIDADLNQHLAESLDINDQSPFALGLHQREIKNILAGSSKHVRPEDMIKTTPPSTGSWIANSIFDLHKTFSTFFLQKNNLILGNVGEQQDEDVGIRCYHSKNGIVELLLNHLVEKKDEVIVVDMVAGADAFASGLYDKFDLTAIVVEPTQKSISVFQQYAEQAKKLGVCVRAVGNKVLDQEDEEYLKSALGNDLIGCMSHSAFVKKQERGEYLSISELEPENRQLLLKIFKNLQNQEKNWKKYLERTIEIHIKNAKSWGNASKGKDLEDQIDTSFTYPI